MAWLDESGIRDKFNIQSNAYPRQIESAIKSAARKIRRWVNADAYADASGTPPPTDADELIRYDAVVDAHAFLTMYYLAISVGSKLSSDGFIKQNQSASSPATQQTITNQYLTPAEMAAKKREYYDEAWDMIEPYAIVETSETAFAQPVYPTSIAVVADW